MIDVVASFGPESGDDEYTDASGDLVDVDAAVKCAVRRADALWLAFASDPSESEEVRRSAVALAKILSSE